MEEPCVMVCGGHVSGLDMVWRGHHDSGGVVEGVCNCQCCDKACWRPTCVALMACVCDVCVNMC